MKLSAAAILLAVSGASAYNLPTRSTLRSLGTKSVVASGSSSHNVNTMKMESESTEIDPVQRRGFLLK
jgi:hypothetical protein